MFWVSGLKQKENNTVRKEKNAKESLTKGENKTKGENEEKMRGKRKLKNGKRAKRFREMRTREERITVWILLFVESLQHLHSFLRPVT